MASYFLLSSGSTPRLDVVITGSLANSSSINFSASLYVSKSSALSPWGAYTSSISNFNSLTLYGYPVTTSMILNMMDAVSQSTGYSLPSASISILRTFITSSSMVDLFASCSITLG